MLVPTSINANTSSPVPLVTLEQLAFIYLELLDHHLRFISNVNTQLENLATTYSFYPWPCWDQIKTQVLIYRLKLYRVHNVNFQSILYTFQLVFIGYNMHDLQVMVVLIQQVMIDKLVKKLSDDNFAVL